MAKKYICTCLQKCKGGKEVSRSTYQRHKSDRDKDAMVSQAGAGITTAMEVEDSDSEAGDFDSEAGDTGDFSGLGFGDESGMDIDEIAGNYTENYGTLGMVCDGI
jgi:hypothetical protein